MTISASTKKAIDTVDTVDSVCAGGRAAPTPTSYRYRRYYVTATAGACGSDA